MIDLEHQDIKYLPGVGPQRAKVLGEELQIHTLHDLLYTFPYKHIDRTRLYYIHELTGDMPYVQIRGQILRMCSFPYAWLMKPCVCRAARLR